MVVLKIYLTNRPAWCCLFQFNNSNFFFFFCLPYKRWNFIKPKSITENSIEHVFSSPLYVWLIFFFFSSTSTITIRFSIYTTETQVSLCTHERPNPSYAPDNRIDHRRIDSFIVLIYENII